jgi:ubiquinone/menaquinone biosynthesis C-methylase UbiE
VALAPDSRAFYGPAMLRLARTARSALLTIGARLKSPQDWLPSLRAAASWLATPSGAPHFVRDYRKMVADLVLANGAATAMELGVGGRFEAIGQVQADLLLKSGLQPAHRLVDVGCGSGRLAAALSSIQGLRYLGTDVVPEFVRHARSVARSDFEFQVVDGLTIPAQDESADFVTLFSVLTHLHAPETFIYLEEAVRVLKPGGKIVATFLDLADAAHWPVFTSTVENIKLQHPWPLNAFLTADIMRMFAHKLGLAIEQMLTSAEAPLLGQSVAVLRKP